MPWFLGGVRCCGEDSLLELRHSATGKDRVLLAKPSPAGFTTCYCYCSSSDATRISEECFPFFFLFEMISFTINNNQIVWFRQHDEENIHKCCKWWEHFKRTQKNLSTSLSLLDVMIVLKDKWYLAARNIPIWWLKVKSIFFEQNMLIWSFQLFCVNHSRCKIMYCFQ